MEDERDTKFAHLLQPIRDLAENWNIDVAKDLEEYLEDLENITISFDGGKTSLNFARAALLIQGSACIYSKKVEYLYTLIYQTLDLLAQQTRRRQKSSLNEDGMDEDAVIEAEQEFLLLDDVVPEGKNIDIREEAGTLEAIATVASGRRLPPGTPKAAVAATHGDLMARTPLSRLSSHRAGQDGHDQFRLSVSAVDQSGALLLDHSQHPLLAAPVIGFQQQQGRQGQHGQGSAGAAAAAAAIDAGGRDVSGVADVPTATSLFGAGMDDGHDDGGFEWMGGDDEEVHVPPMMPPVSQERDPWHPTPTRLRQQGRHEASAVPAGQDSQQQENENEPDLWAMWDPHAFAPAGVEKPFRKGKTFSVPSNPIAIARGGPDADPSAKPSKGSVRTLAGLDGWNPGFDLFRLSAPTSMMTAAPFFKELQPVFRAQQKVAQRERLAHSREKGAAAVVDDGGFADDDGMDDDAGFDMWGGGDDEPVDEGDGEPLGFFLGGNDEGEGPSGISMNLDSALDDSHAYENLVQKHIDAFLRGADAFVQETQLSKRVNEWEQRIGPALLLEEERPEFDIGEYGHRILETLETRHVNEGASAGAVDGSANAPEMSFQDIVEGVPRFDVCRFFLVTLQLANGGNVFLSHDDDCGESKAHVMDPSLLRIRFQTSSAAHDATRLPPRSGTGVRTPQKQQPSARKRSERDRAEEGLDVEEGEAADSSDGMPTPKRVRRSRKGGARNRKRNETSARETGHTGGPLVEQEANTAPAPSDGTGNDAPPAKRTRRTKSKAAGHVRE